MEAVSSIGSLVSLTFDMFDNTIRLFKFVSALVDMPKDCEKFRLLLIIEYNRVLSWGKVAGLVHVPPESNLAVTLGTNATELLGVLARVQWLLAEFRDLNDRYSNESNLYRERADVGNEKEQKEGVAEASNIAKQISGLAGSYEEERKQRKRSHMGLKSLKRIIEKAASNTKDVITQPRRVRWVAVDKEAFQALLENLHVLTERLHELMDEYRGKKIEEITSRTYREMILARDELHALRSMLEAVASLIKTRSETGQKEKRADDTHQALQDLIRLKKVSRTSEVILSRAMDHDHEGGLDMDTSMAELGVTVPRFGESAFDASFAWNEDTEDLDTLLSLMRPKGILSTKDGDIPVWIEWKTLGDIVPGSTRDKQCQLRTVALAEMLHLTKPRSLCAPTCVGYFDDREVHSRERWAWIFRMPETCDYDTQIISLHDMLGHDRPKPTLAQRVSLAVRLATSLSDLHSVSWLHKGIFSDNVLFHCWRGSENLFDPEKPVLSGFEFSRPEGMNTTSRIVDERWDLYRWPGIQREAPSERNSRKTYDIYSLGLLLLEIAHWRPLYDLMGFGKREESSSTSGRAVSLHDSKSVRDWLLGKLDSGAAPFDINPVKQLRHLVGERYFRAVTRCLWAHGESGMGVEETADQSRNSDVGIQLQEAFTVHVVEELGAVDV